MLCLHSGLVLGTIVCLFVVGGSLEHGYPIEVAVVRGLVGFIGISLMGYVGELVVATAPPRRNVVRAPARPHETPAAAVLSPAQDDMDDEAGNADMRRAA